MTETHHFEVTSEAPSPQRARNRLGAARKHGKPPDVIDQLTRDLHNAKLAKAIDDRVNSALGLTDAEAMTLAARLRPTFSHDDSVHEDTNHG